MSLLTNNVFSSPGNSYWSANGSGGGGGGGADTWYQFPTQNGEILFDVSGYSQQTLKAIPNPIDPLLTDLEWENSSVLPYSWYNYATLSGNIVFVDASGNHNLQSVGGDLFFDGTLLARAGDIQDIAAWSDYPMIHPLVGNGFSITGVNDISAASMTLSGTLTANVVDANDIIASSISAAADVNCNFLNVFNPLLGLGVDPTTETTIFEGNIVNGGDISTNTIHAFSTSSSSLNVKGGAIVGSLLATGDPGPSFAPAPGIIQAVEYDIQNVGGTGTGKLTTNTTGTELLFNGVQIQTGTPADVSQWSTFPAVSDISTNGFNIKGGSGPLTISAQDLTLTGSTTLSLSTKATTRSIDMTGVINQTFAGSGGNYFQSGTQIGSNGILPTDNFGTLAVYGGNVPGGLSSLYVRGGTTLDGGGIIHGITIGTAPVAGINTQRIDVLPVGILLTTPTFITMNGLGAANISMGGAIAIAAGSYITLEHGAGLGANGIFVQNTARTSGARLVFAFGGTIYNLNNLQTDTIQIASDIQFWNNRYDPSGGAVPVRPPTHGEAWIDVSSHNVYLATVNAGSIPATQTNSNSVYIGNLPNLTTGGASTIAIGDISGMTGQGAGSIAIGRNAGVERLGADAIAIGYNCGNDASGQSVSIGYDSGYSQGGNSIAIGTNAGTLQGTNSIAIGKLANSVPAASSNNTIVLNATGASLDAVADNSTYIAPLRNVSTQPAATAFALGYTTATGEITVANTKINEIENTVNNTQQISYDTGLLTTTINGITSLQTVNTSGPVSIGNFITPANLNVSGNITLTDASGNTATKVVAQPQYVYYVAKNGRVGATGAITDPLSTITAALAKTAAVGGGRPGMTIYLAPGEYSEDIVINISATLPAVSIIGMSDDTQSSKRVQLTGSVLVNGTDATFTNTIDTVVLNNITLLAKNATTSAITIRGAGIRVYLKNGLFTNQFVATAPLIDISSSGVLPTTVAQLAIDDCSLTMDSATASGHIISMVSGQLFSINYSDLTHKGTGSVIVMTGGAFGSATQSAFNSNGAVISLVSSAASLTSFTNCLIAGKASPTVALITCGTNSNLNLTDSTVQNTNTTEANSTSRYVYLTAGVLVSALRNNFSSSASPAITLMQPFQSTTPASSILFYFSNVYTNASNTVRAILPTWLAVQQFSNDITPPTTVVRATSGTAITLTPTTRGNTYILTGTTTQAFTAVGLVASDVGYSVVVHNGNGVGGGDINLTGMTGTTIVHNRTATANGGVLYLYWTGLGLVGY